MIRRAKVVVTEGLTQLRNAYPNSEFILSTDPLFRPVNMTTAPDGTLYIVDMYHGIIQESEWTPQGSYLRKKIEQYQLDKITSHGRIWRLVYDGIEPNQRQPRMLDERAGAARGSSRAPERLVARYGAEAARSPPGQVGRAGAARDDAQFLQRARTLSRDVDARGPGRARRDAGARSAERSQPAHSRAGDPRERVALQGRGHVVRGRHPAAHEGPGYARHHPGDADAEPLEGLRTSARSSRPRRPRTRRAACRKSDAGFSGRRRRRSAATTQAA